MKKIVFVFFIVSIFTSPLLAGELYSCKDRSGNTIVTTSPQDDMTDCVLKDSYEEPAPVEKKKMSLAEEREEVRKQNEQYRKEEIGRRQKSECGVECSRDSQVCYSDCNKTWRGESSEARWKECKNLCLYREKRCMSDCKEHF